MRRARTAVRNARLSFRVSHAFQLSRRRPVDRGADQVSKGKGVGHEASLGTEF